MGKAERQARIKDRLLEIADRDTELVVETHEAVRRMMQLGFTTEQTRGLLDEMPEALDSKTDKASFFGFASRRQASLAAFSGMSKKDRPAALGDVQERVNSLIKNQKEERAAGTIGLAIISIPAPQALPEGGPVKRFRRLQSGKMKELTGAADDYIDTTAEEVESTVTVKERKA